MLANRFICNKCDHINQTVFVIQYGMTCVVQFVIPGQHDGSLDSLDTVISVQPVMKHPNCS